MHSKHEEMSQILFLDVNFRFQLYPVQIDEFRIDAQLTDQNYFPRLIAQYVNGGTGTLWPIIGVELKGVLHGLILKAWAFENHICYSVRHGLSCQIYEKILTLVITKFLSWCSYTNNFNACRCVLVRGSRSCSSLFSRWFGSLTIGVLRFYFASDQKSLM